MSDDLIQKFSGLVDMAEGGLQSKVHEQALRIQAQAKNYVLSEGTVPGVDH